jgi:F-type H+-transporting ATPase subunit delta
MAEPSAIARPYARAVFELALEERNFDAWSKALGTLKSIVEMPNVAALLDHPKLTRPELADLIVAAGKDLGKEAKYLVQVLSQNRRLRLIPHIAQMFEAMRAEEEKRTGVFVTSATALSDAQKQSLAAALSKRLGRDVELQLRVDPELLGGAIIRAGDLVIDGSVKSELSRLAQALAT